MAETKEKFQDVYSYILSEETSFKTKRVPLASNWEWSMYEHIDRSFLLKNSQFSKGSNDDFSRPFNNIIIPIANVNYRSEGFDVKDVELFVNKRDSYHLSLMARKFHNRWAKKYSIDTAIDDSVESYFDYGLALVKDINEQRPTVIDLKCDLAFCDQSDVLSGPICLKWDMGIDEVLGMKGKWFPDEVDTVISNASFTKEVDDVRSQSPAKTVRVYELHGVFPASWLDKDGVDDNGKYIRQIHIISFYTDMEGNKNGITLYRGEIDNKFKALKRDKIAKRACGRGGIEELFHPQIWTNFSEIHVHQALEATSKVVTMTTDDVLAKNNNLSKLKHNQIVKLSEGKDWRQLVLQPINKERFDANVNKWEQNARVIGSASDPQLGLNPVSGTPLGTTEIVTNQGEGIHQYRRGKIATFWGEIYRDWVLEYIKNDINKGDEWIDELTADELEDLAEMVVTKKTNKRIKEIMLSGKISEATEENIAPFRDMVKQEFTKGGKKRFIKLLKDEFKDIPLDVDFNIAGKQKNLFDIVNKLNAIFRTVFTNPQVLQQPGMSELFNEILEDSGFSPINFSSLTSAPSSAMQPPQMPGMGQSPDMAGAQLQAVA